MSILSEIIRIIYRKPPAKIEEQILPTIEDQITSGNLDQGYEKIKDYKDQLATDNRFAEYLLTLVEIRFDAETNNLDVATTKLDKIDDTYSHPIIDLIKEIERANVTRIGGDLADAQNILENISDEIEEIKRIYPIFYKRIKSRHHNILAKILNKTGQFEESIRLLTETLSLLEELDYTNQLAEPLNDLGISYATIADAENALKYLNQSLEIYVSAGNKTQSLKLYNNIGLFNYNIGNLDPALDNFLKSLELADELKVKHYSAHIQMNLGLVYLDKGQIVKAEEFFVAALEIAEELANKHIIATIKSNLANVYQTTGEVDKSIKFFKESRELFEELDSKNDLAILLNNMASVYEIKGLSSKAISLVEQAIDLLTEIGNYQYLPHALYQAIELNVENNRQEEAEEYLKLFEQDRTKMQTKLADHLFKLSRSLILLQSDRVVKKAEAQTLLQEIADDEIIGISYTINAYLKLGNLLLQELQMSASEEALNEFKTLISRLDKVTKGATVSANITPTMVQVLILRSKLALIDLDVEEAQKLLDEAHDLAGKNGLRQLAKMVDQEREAVKNEMMKYKKMVETNASLYERLQESQIENYLKRAENILKK